MPESKYEAILELLAAGPLSTHEITERLNEQGIRVNGNGQTLGRLKNLERRGRVVRIPGERENWKKWALTTDANA